MANIAIFKAGKEPQYLTSVDTGEWVVSTKVPKNKIQPKDPDVVINPDISTVKDIPVRYWKRSGNTIISMNQQEKDAVDNEKKSSRKDAIDKLQIDGSLLAEALIAAGIVTKKQIVDAVKAKEGLNG